MNPYREWLGITTPGTPDHYALLGLKPFESHRGQIEQSSLQRAKKVRCYQVGAFEKQALDLLNQIAAARVCLLAPAAKEEYDRRLRGLPGATAHDTVPPARTGGQQPSQQLSGVVRPHPQPSTASSQELDEDLVRLFAAVAAQDEVPPIRSTELIPPARREAARRSRGRWIATASAAALVLLLGIILVLPSGDGTIPIDGSDLEDVTQVSTHGGSPGATPGIAEKSAWVDVPSDKNSGGQNNLRISQEASGASEVEPAVAEFVEGLKDEDAFKRDRAAIELGKMGAQAASAVPALIEALRDKTWFVRWDAAQALGKIGSLAQDAVPALTVCLQDGNDDVRRAASEALKCTDPSSAIALSDTKSAPKEIDRSNTASPAKTLRNTIGMTLAYIPPGSFMMGSPSTEAKRSDAEGPQHLVRITNPFYMGIYEVTQTEYERLMGKNPAWFSRYGQGKDSTAGLDTGRFPVEEVSWDEAVEFCQRLSALAAERAAGRHYRLPSEAEWEYACRARTTTPFYHGAASDPTKANFDGNYWYGGGRKGPSLKRTTTVGSYPPNAFGLFDMHGNVFEWCQDRWHERYDGAPTAGSAWEAGGDASRRVLRGGSWLSDPGLTRSANRYRSTLDLRNYYMGFRVVSEIGVRTP